jgi:hypothetical protein
MKGMSLSDYLVREVTQIADQPTLDEVLERISKSRPIELVEPAALTIRKLRDSR